MSGIGTVARVLRWSILGALLVGSTAEAGRIRHRATPAHPASDVLTGIDGLWSKAVHSVETGISTTTSQDRAMLDTLYRDLIPQHPATHPGTITWHRYRALPPAKATVAEAQILAVPPPTSTFRSPSPATASVPVSASARRPLVAEAQVLGPAQAVPEPSGLLVACLLIGVAAAGRRRRAG